MTAMARCPVCRREVRVFWHGDRRLFTFHGPWLTDIACEASGWHVEDDELVVVPRKQRSDAGIARPSRTMR